MSKTTVVGSGKSAQKVTTYYDEGEKEKEGLKHHGERAALNMKLKSEAGKAPVTPSKERLDARKNLPKEEEKEEELEEPKPRKQKAKPQKEPTMRENLGHNVGRYVAANNGMPAWMRQGAAMPPAMRLGSGRLPPVYTMGMGNPPPYLLGGIPGVPVAKKQPKKQQGNGLPAWFRY